MKKNKGLLHPNTWLDWNPLVWFASHCKIIQIKKAFFLKKAEILQQQHFSWTRHKLGYIKKIKKDVEKISKMDKY